MVIVNLLFAANKEDVLLYMKCISKNPTHNVALKYTNGYFLVIFPTFSLGMMPIGKWETCIFE